MPTTDILGYCVFDTVIDLADEAATAAIEAEMASYLNGTGANYTVVTADVSETTWFEGGSCVVSRCIVVTCRRTHVPVRSQAMFLRDAQNGS